MAQPYFKFYPKDFLANDGIRTLNLQEQGAFLNVYMRMWTSDMRLKNDDSRISKLLNVEIEWWKALKDKLFEEELLHDDGGFLLNQSLYDLYLDTEERCEKAKGAADKRWELERKKKSDTKPKYDPDDHPFGE